MKPQHGRHYEWSILLLFTLSFALTSFDRWLLPTLFPVAGEDLGINVADLSNISAVMTLVFGVSAFLAGIGSDRWGRRPLIVGSIIVFSLCSALTGLVGGFLSLLLVRALLGATEGSFNTPMYAAAVEASHPKRRGFNMGLVISAFPLFGLGIGPIVATQLLNVLPSWQWVFFLSAIPGLIVAALIALRYRKGLNYPPVSMEEQGDAVAPKGGRATTSPRDILRVLRVRNIQVSAASTMMALATMFVLGGLMPTYLTEIGGVSISSMGLIMSAIGFGGFTGQLVLAGASDLWGRRPLLILESFGAAVCLVLIWLLGENPVVLFALLFGAAFFTFAVLSLAGGPIVAEAAPEGRLGAANGLVVGGGEIIGSSLLGAIIGNIAQVAGLHIVPILGAVLMVVSIFAALALKETAPRVVQRAAGRLDSQEADQEDIRLHS